MRNWFYIIILGCTINYFKVGWFMRKFVPNENHPLYGAIHTGSCACHVHGMSGGRGLRDGIICGPWAYARDRMLIEMEYRMIVIIVRIR